MGLIRIYSGEEWKEIENQNRYEERQRRSQQMEQEFSVNYMQKLKDEFVHSSERESYKVKDLIMNKQRLVERLQLYGLRERRKIPGDGNCQFAAIGDQLFNNPRLHLDIRKIVAEWLRENPHYEVEKGSRIIDFLDTECYPNWNAYCDSVSQDGTWGDHFTLLAISEIFECVIAIVSSVDLKHATKSEAITVIRPRFCEPNKIALLSHLHENHYSSLVMETS